MQPNSNMPPIQPSLQLIGTQVLRVEANAWSEEALKPATWQMNLDFKHEFWPQHFALVFDLKLTLDNSPAFFHIVMQANFQSDLPLDETFKASPFARVNAPAIAFPYLRAFLSTLTTSMGINNIILPALNFTQN